MTYICWELSFKAVVISHRAESESSRLSLLREMWVFIASCLPRTFWDACVCRAWGHDCSPSPDLPPASIHAVFTILCWSSPWTIMILVNFLFSYFTWSAALLHQMLSHQFVPTFSILFKSTSVHSSHLFVSSLLIHFLLEWASHHPWRLLKNT